MLEKSTISFLKLLKANNNKEWMDANRASYLSAKSNMEAFTTDLLRVLARMDNTLAPLQAKDCTFRMNRDIRFSQNKAPYKTNMACYVARGGKKSPFAGYYCHFEPGQSFFASGVWMPMPDVLKKVRQEIDYSFGDFKKILIGKNFRETFGDLDRSEGFVLSRPPKGYETENPAIEYLKLKSFIISTPLDEKLLTSSGLVDYVAGLCKIARPFVDFLNTAIGEEEG
jgi:uncharacterized protein (TIGR02453 family)